MIKKDVGYTFKQLKLVVFIICSLFFMQLFSSNVKISNVRLSHQQEEKNGFKSDLTKRCRVVFNLDWDNSFRTASPDENWDAVWVTIKYKVYNGGCSYRYWQQCYLDTASILPTDMRASAGTLSPNSAYDMQSNPVIGFFIYRKSSGQGSLSLKDIALIWNFGLNDAGCLNKKLAMDTYVDISVNAVEMVYIPGGGFKAGTGGTEVGCFTDGSYVATNLSTPFYIKSEDELNIAGNPDCLWSTSTDNSSSVGVSGSLPKMYPKGTMPFYNMKYEISQQQYVNFLNSIKESVATTMYSALDAVSTRNNISAANNIYSTTTPDVPVTGMSMFAFESYLDWIGLRPMSELEYEKSARGSVNPLRNEYAWGSTYLKKNVGISSAGTSSEKATNGGNSSFDSTEGPLRVGALAKDTTGRVSSGAGYYGNMELSGNVSEYTVSVSTTESRRFIGSHGDGNVLTSLPADWPSLTSGYIGAAVRGGGTTTTSNLLRVSDRTYGSYNPGTATLKKGISGRGVRTLPFCVRINQVTPGSGTASVNSTISNDGGFKIISRGVCWSTSSGPTITGNKTTDGNGLGSFTSTLTSLTAGTVYYVRAYATNVNSTQYSEEVVFMNKKCGAYIASGVWRDFMCYNLGVDVLNSDPLIPIQDNNGSYYQWGVKNAVASAKSSATAITGWSTTAAVSGSWSDSQKTDNDPCPTNFRIPTKAEWEGVKANNTITKTPTTWGSAGVTQFYNGVKFGTGLMLPAAGIRSSADGSLSNRGASCSYWSSTENGSASWLLSYDGSAASLTGSNRTTAASIRCIRDDKPQIVTAAPYSTTFKSTTTGGEIKDEGLSSIIARGVCWNTSENPTINNPKTTDGTGMGSFTSNVMGLNAKTKYYLRAYATNASGTVYGKQMTFTTTEICGAYISSGVWRNFMCHNLGVNADLDPNIANKELIGNYYIWGIKDPIANQNTSAGALPNFKSLIPNNSWINATKSSTDPCPSGFRIPTYTEMATFFNKNTITFSNSQNQQANFGDLMKVGSKLTFIFGGEREPSNGFLDNNSPIVYMWLQDGSINALNTTYSAPVRVENYNVSSNYGFSVRCIEDNNAVTITLPTISTLSVGPISTNSATSGGNVSNDGGAPITARGICWSTSQNPTTAITTKTMDGTGSGAFTSSMVNLTPGTIYYARAYATNSAGTAYGAQVSFTTMNAAIGGTATAANTLICSESSTSISLTGSSGTIQWEQSANGSSNWFNVVGGSGYSKSIFYTPALSNTTYYRARLTYGVTTAYSSVVTVTVTPKPVAGIITVVDPILYSGNSTTVYLSGYSGSIQWQQYTSGTSWVNVSSGSGATSAAYSTPPLTKTTSYRALISNGTCSVYSTTVKVIVNAMPGSNALKWFVNTSQLTNVANSIKDGLVNTKALLKWSTAGYNLDINTNGLPKNLNASNLAGIKTPVGAVEYCMRKNYDANGLLISGTTSSNMYYLPAIVELNQLWIDRSCNEAFLPQNYWSSTENNATSSWTTSFMNGLNYFSSKALTLQVRCIHK